jgi:hypothetical protein
MLREAASHRKLSLRLHMHLLENHTYLVNSFTNVTSYFLQGAQGEVHLVRAKEQTAAPEMALKVVAQTSTISSDEDLHVEVRFLFWALSSCTRRLISHCHTYASGAM